MLFADVALLLILKIVHDAFNWLTVIILLPIEVATGYLYYMTRAMVAGIHTPSDSENPMFLKVITEPLTKAISQVAFYLYNSN